MWRRREVQRFINTGSTGRVKPYGVTNASQNASTWTQLFHVDVTVASGQRTDPSWAHGQQDKTKENEERQREMTLGGVRFPTAFVQKSLVSLNAKYLARCISWRGQVLAAPGICRSLALHLQMWSPEHLQESCFTPQAT